MNIKKKIDVFVKSLKAFYQRANKMSGGVIEIIRVTFTRFGEERGSEAAASLAYYGFFSIFPMLLVFIVVGSFFVDAEMVQAQLIHLLQVVPGAEDIVIENIEQVLRLRGSVTIIAVISLVWSATGVFNILAKNINRAFIRAEVPDFFKGRFLGFLMFMGLGFLMVLSLTASTIAGLIPVIRVPINDIVLHETIFWRFGVTLTPVLINFLMFWAMYQWVPTVSVRRRAAVITGIIAAVALELLNNILSWLLRTGMIEYQLVYGSLGTIVALLFYVYLVATLVLIGAHLTASINQHINRKHD